MNETFDTNQVICAIQQFLEFGEQEYVEHKNEGELGHMGYFSRNGWAARCLRFHLEQITQSHKTPKPELSGSTSLSKEPESEDPKDVA